MRRSPSKLPLLLACWTLGATDAGAAPASPLVNAAASSAAVEVEPPITTPGPEGDYLRALHREIHFRWATKFVAWGAKKRPATDKLNDPTLEAEVLFTVRWDGSASQVTISESSGVVEFDAAAAAAVNTEHPYPVPPVDIYGDDGVAHFRWVFARNARLCSGGEVRRFEAPLKDALPRLFVQGRTKEALLRVARYTRTGDPDAMSEFSRSYLRRSFPDPSVDAHAAAALVRAGDQKAIDRLRPALARPDTMPLAASAFGAAKVDVCAMVEPALKGADAEQAQKAARMLRASEAELPAESPCVAALTAAIKNPMASAATRAEMLDTLTTVTPNGVRKLALEAIGDSDPKMRAAGVRAFARKGGGRPTLYRLQPLIGDPSVEVRAAVAAGLVRACGDLAKDHLQPFFKGRDVQPLVAMAPELGKWSTPGTAELLAKLQKRPEAELRMPVFAALAERQDPAGRALYQPLAEQVKNDPYAAPEARRIIYSNAGASELATMAKDPFLGPLAYRALLRAKRHPEAMDWLVGSFDRLQPEIVVDALGAWLAEPPSRLSKK